ncbi:MAG: fumarylacetoacetate hydrolase family protein, partial [Pseudomonadota bacterium]
AADAAAHIWGATLVNDISVRDLQRRHGQFFIGKAQDNGCPMGPALVSKDEFDLADLRLRTWVNDELRQDGHTRQLIFSPGAVIEQISAGVTLYPGDVIALGTPAGVGAGFDPPRFLKPGDEVRIRVDEIGELANPVAAYPG